MAVFEAVSFYNFYNILDRLMRTNLFWSRAYKLADNLRCKIFVFGDRQEFFSRILDFDRPLNISQFPSRHKPLTLQEPFSMPRMVVIDGRRSKIVAVQRSTDPVFEASDAEIPSVGIVIILVSNLHPRFLPKIVMDHVVFPFAFVSTATLTGARRRIDTAILTKCTHWFSRFSSTNRRIISEMETPKSLARFSSHFIWSLVNTIDRCIVFMWTRLALDLTAVKCL